MLYYYYKYKYSTLGPKFYHGILIHLRFRGAGEGGYELADPPSTSVHRCTVHDNSIIGSDIFSYDLK